MLEILHQDDRVVAVHKPSGLLVHRSMLDRHETAFALQMVRDQTGRHVHPVHRLDKGTSGILLFAFDRDAARTLSGAFERRDTLKRYIAVVRGYTAEAGTIDHALRRHDEEAGQDKREGDLQAAVTHYRRLATVELPIYVDRYPTSRYSLVQLEPETGRRHQIRRHLKHLSHPVIGDATWGKGRHNRMFGERFGSLRLLLASTALEIEHPDGDRRLNLHCRPAEDFMGILRALGWDGVLPGTDNS